MASRKLVLPLIVLSQFCCTSMWFAANGVMDQLILTFRLPPSALSHLTSAVQLGFITGTLVFAIFTVADRFTPGLVFFVSAVLGAICNTALVWDENSFYTLLTARFGVGFFLAGIYPVGMKIASDYFREGLGKSLGFLVGALVLGTALPHFLLFTGSEWPWKYVVIATSSLAVFGGIIMLAIGDGPYRKKTSRPDLTAFFKVFKNPDLRSAAFGYFGHMWELYAFWAFVPVILLTYQNLHNLTELSIPLWSFIIIGIGGIACVIGGYLSSSYGLDKVARSALKLSGFCCLLSPFAFLLPLELFLIFLLIWGMAVIADSPLFSSLVAQTAPQKYKGTALTIVTSLGFLITIISIQLISLANQLMDSRYIFLVLAVGPFFGLITRKRSFGQS